VIRPAEGGQPSEPGEQLDTEIAWDDVVDVICVGSDPGPVAHAIAAAGSGLRVLVVARPDVWDTDTAAYIAEMTAELPAPPEGPAVAVTLGRAIDAQPARGRVIDTFDGARLSEFAAQCWASPLGVLYTDVYPPAALGATPMRTGADLRIEAIVIGTCAPDCALAEWLAARALDDGIRPDRDVMWTRLVVEFGRVVGVELESASGPVLVRAMEGVALPTARHPPDPPAQPGLPAAEVAIVGLVAGRFSRVELLVADHSSGMLKDRNPELGVPDGLGP
jgi:hypothetical protein